jgi:hypothetical protein
VIEADLKSAGEGIIAEWCLAVRQNAMDAIGTYKYDWRPLAASRVERKGGRDEPLLDTGQLLDSIRASVKITGPTSGRAIVGTNEIERSLCGAGNQIRAALEVS